MDPTTSRALDAIASAVREVPPPGPVQLTAEYLRTIELAEELPVNRTGTDKTWTERVLAEWLDALKSARRVPRR